MSYVLYLIKCADVDINPEYCNFAEKLLNQ